MKLLFTLGREPIISIEEIHAVCTTLGISYTILLKNNNQLIIETEKNCNPTVLMNRLGGTIKISELIPKKKTPVETITDALQKNIDGKIHFSVSGDKNKYVAIATKKQLKDHGLSVRYIAPKNTATILHNNLVTRESDFTVIDENVYVTRAIQPMEDFANRDYKRPCIDSKSGMLPPKLARTLVNLTYKNTEATILDPFCGSGTLLMEAVVMGFTHIIGSDISKEAVEDSKKNLSWLQDNLKFSTSNLQIIQSEVHKLEKILPSNSIDAIATEPYMGQPLCGNKKMETVQKQIHELATLYTNAFRVFHSILKKDGVIIFIIPEFHIKNTIIHVDCVKKIETIGFELLPWSKDQEHLTYHRPNQYIARTIWRFIKK